MDIEQTTTELKAFRSELTKITRSRHPLEIRHFIVGHHENRWRQWYQLCIQCDEKWAAIEEAEANRQIMELEIREMNIRIELLLRVIVVRGIKTESWDQNTLDEIAIEKLRVEIQRKKNQLARGESLMLGALKEIQDYATLARTEYSDFLGKDEDTLAATHEHSYWVDRLSRQVAVDLLTYGKVQAGNLECLLQLPEATRAEILRSAIPRIDAQVKLAHEVEHAYELELQKVKEITNVSKSH